MGAYPTSTLLLAEPDRQAHNSDSSFDSRLRGREGDVPMESEPLPRKLAAILYADVAGYSRLTGEDEDATHRRLSEE